MSEKKRLTGGRALFFFHNVFNVFGAFELDDIDVFANRFADKFTAQNTGLIGDELRLKTIGSSQQFSFGFIRGQLDRGENGNR